MKSRLIFILLLVGVHLHGQVFLGKYTGNTRKGKTVTINADTSALQFTFYMPDILRVDFLPSPSTKCDSSFVVVRDTIENVPISLVDTDSSLTISSAAIRIQCRKYPLRISFSDSAQKFRLEEPRSGGISSNQAERIVRFSLSSDEHFYGTGERGTSLDKRGQAFESYNMQIGSYSSPLPTMNLNVPFLASTKGYAIYFDNTYKGRFDLGLSDTTTFSYSATGGELTYYLISASTIQRQLEKYTWLTGRQPLPPRWAFGFIQSKNRYQNGTEARSIVTTLREKKFPCDALVLDLAWFDKMGDIGWNVSSWPDPEKMVSDFLLQGIKTIVITEPYIVETSMNYNEAVTNGFLAKDSLGHPYILNKWWSCGGCNAALLDLTNRAARQWWWSKHPGFLGKYVAGLWTDLGEPERHPIGMYHSLGTTAKVHNIYNLLWAKTIFEGFSAYRPGERVFNLTRSGFAGIQRYGAIPWSGDVARDFGGLAVQLPMMLNMGMSGLAYHNSDIGGYSRTPTTPELYIRWMQYGTFCPIARAHGAGEVVHGYPTEPWQFGTEAEQICRAYIQLRYQLLPYIYTLAHENYETGRPLARPLFWETPKDTFFNESSSYLWGDAFLVSPVVKMGQTSKTLYLPEGTWVNFWNDEFVEGGKTINVAAPIDVLPLFVKAGSIIPMAPIMNYSDERPTDTLTLKVYPGDTGISSFTLYEDDGKTLAYQSGRYALTTFTQSVDDNGASLRLSIGPSLGEFAGRLQRRSYLVEVHGVSIKPANIRSNGRALREWSLTSPVQNKQEGFSYDKATRILVALVSVVADSSYQIFIEGTRFRK